MTALLDSQFSSQSSTMTSTVVEKDHALPGKSINYAPGNTIGLQPVIRHEEAADKNGQYRSHAIMSNSAPSLSSLVTSPRDIARAYTASSGLGLVRFHRSRARRPNIRHTISNPIPISVPAHALHCPAINTGLKNKDPPPPQPPPPPPNTPERPDQKGKAPASALGREHTIAQIKRQHADPLRSQPSLNFSEVQTDETISLSDLIRDEVQEPVTPEEEIVVDSDSSSMITVIRCEPSVEAAAKRQGLRALLCF